MFKCDAVVKQKVYPNSKVERSSGFWITFENDWTISVQWGPGRYADNRGMTFMEAFADCDLTSKVVEIAGWHEIPCEECFDGFWLDPDCEECSGTGKVEDYWYDFDKREPCKPSSYVKGWVTADELLGHMRDVSRIGIWQRRYTKMLRRIYSFFAS